MRESTAGWQQTRNEQTNPLEGIVKHCKIPSIGFEMLDQGK